MARNVSDEEITTAMTTGITFKGAKLRKPQEEKVKTKACLLYTSDAADE